jgi:hypothetical protein
MIVAAVPQPTAPRVADRKNAAATDDLAAVEQTPGNVRLARNLVTWLEQREVERVGQAMAAERGLRWRPVAPGDRLQGKIVGSTRLASGRFAMIDDGLGFSLVPWNDTVGRQLGRQISGVGLPGGGIE